MDTVAIINIFSRGAKEGRGDGSIESNNVETDGLMI